VKYLTLRLFLRLCSILRDEDASALPTTTATATPTTSAQTAFSNWPNTVRLVVGLTLGLLTLTALVFAGISYLHSWRRTSTDVGAHTVPPPTQLHP